MAQSFPPTGDYSNGPRRYPWHEWADGNVWLVKRGEDFDCTLKSFTITPYQHARNNPQNHQKVVMRAYAATDEVMFQFYPEDQQTPVLPAKAIAQLPPDQPTCRVCHDVMFRYNDLTLGEHVESSPLERGSDRIAYFSAHDEDKIVCAEEDFANYSPENPLQKRDS